MGGLSNILWCSWEAWTCKEPRASRIKHGEDSVMLYLTWPGLPIYDHEKKIVLQIMTEIVLYKSLSLYLYVGLTLWDLLKLIRVDRILEWNKQHPNSASTFIYTWPKKCFLLLHRYHINVMLQMLAFYIFEIVHEVSITCKNANSCDIFPSPKCYFPFSGKAIGFKQKILHRSEMFLEWCIQIVETNFTDLGHTGSQFRAADEYYSSSQSTWKKWNSQNSLTF